MNCSKCASCAAASNLSVSKPSPGAGAGRVTWPVVVRTNRRIVHLPGGMSQVNRPSGDIFDVRSTTPFCGLQPSPGEVGSLAGIVRKGFTPGAEENGAR